MGGEFDFRRLKRVVSIERVLAAYGALPQMRRQGNRLIGACPIHNGDNLQAFVADLERNLWYCFTQCATGGDVVDLVRGVERVDFRGAAERLAALAEGAGLGVIPRPTPRSSPVLERAFTPFTRELRLDPNAPLLQAKGIRRECAIRHEVGWYAGRGWLAGCVGVRLRTPEGQPIGYAGRRIATFDSARTGKWRFPRGLPKTGLLYNYHRARQSWADDLVVVECPWGVLRLDQLGIAAVALLGVSLSAAQRSLLADAPRVTLLLDGDPAGRAAGPRIRDALGPATEVRIVGLPVGRDPDDLSDVQLSAILERVPGT